MSVDLIVLWVHHGPYVEGAPYWTLGPVLVRDSDNVVNRHQLSGPGQVGFSDTDEGIFSYIWRRFLEGDSGNGITYDYTCTSQVELSELDRVVISDHRFNLAEANLEDLVLDAIDLNGRDLTGVHLHGASLVGANLVGATLLNADLQEANLSNSNLSEADLSYANLRYANLDNTDLRGSCLKAATYDSDQLRTCLTNEQTIWTTGESMTGTDVERIRNIVTRVADDYSKFLRGDHPTLATKLRFPYKGDKLRKDSEQEFRFFLCHALESDASGYGYSVETPTTNLYSKSLDIHNQPQGESKSKSKRGNIDVSVWTLDSGAKTPIAHVEIKAGAIGAKAMEWDILKLVREGLPGFWVLAVPPEMTDEQHRRLKELVRNTFDTFAKSSTGSTAKATDETDLTFIFAFKDKVDWIRASGQDWARDASREFARKFLER